MNPFFSSKCFTTQQRGFTLIETMVAISVLAIALVGPFLAVQVALNASYIARDQLIASSLAQEGQEYVRSVRDNNFLEERAWMDGLSSYGCYISGAWYCMLDPTQGDIHTDFPDDSAMRSYSSISAVPFLYVSTNGLYNQQEEGTVTKFKRYVQFDEQDETTVIVTVTVEWTDRSQLHSITVTNTLRDWI